MIRATALLFVYTLAAAPAPKAPEVLTLSGDIEGVHDPAVIDDWNAIDANLVVENADTTWLIWGSVWGGIQDAPPRHHHRQAFRRIPHPVVPWRRCPA